MYRFFLFSVSIFTSISALGAGKPASFSPGNTRAFGAEKIPALQIKKSPISVDSDTKTIAPRSLAWVDSELSCMIAEQNGMEYSFFTQSYVRASGSSIVSDGELRRLQITRKTDDQSLFFHEGTYNSTKTSVLGGKQIWIYVDAKSSTGKRILVYVEMDSPSTYIISHEGQRKIYLDCNIWYPRRVVR